MSIILILSDNIEVFHDFTIKFATNEFVFENHLFDNVSTNNYLSKALNLILLDVPENPQKYIMNIKEINDFALQNNIPFFFLIPQSSGLEILVSMDCKTADFIKKPFSNEELFHKIKIQLKQQALIKGLKMENKSLHLQKEKLTEELGKSKSDFEKIKNELNRLDKTQNSFLSLISHEIRTPLNSISGFIYLLKKQNKVAGLEKYINPLDQSVQRLENFSSKALLLTEISAYGMGEIPMIQINLREMVLFAINNLSQKIDKKNIRIITENLSTNAIINGDEDYILKTIEYVIENAIDYNTQGGSIEIITMVTENEIICSIINTGKGFSQEVLDNLSNLLYPEKHTGQKFGISLAFVAKVMEKLGGYMLIKNTVDGANVDLHFLK